MKGASYNFVTVANNSYAVFLELFVKSLLAVVNPRLINQLYIFDTGLEEKTKDKLYLSEKMLYVSTDIDQQMIELHDNGWQASTYFKTTALLQILDARSEPTIMIDCDTIILRDFGYLLEGEYDIGVCRTDQSTITKYLGAFFVAKNSAYSRRFIETWIEEMEGLSAFPRESPALVNTVDKFDSSRIKEFRESQVCSLVPNSHACIYHLKSGGPLRTVHARLNQSHLKPLLSRYLR